MCTVISGDCGCSKSSSSGVSLEGIAVAISLTAAVSLTTRSSRPTRTSSCRAVPGVGGSGDEAGRRVLLWLARRVLWVGAGGVMLWRWSAGAERRVDRSRRDPGKGLAGHRLRADRRHEPGVDPRRRRGRLGNPDSG